MISMSQPSSYQATTQPLIEAESLLNRFITVKTLSNLDNNFTISSSSLVKTQVNVEFNKKGKFFQLPPIKENSPMEIKNSLLHIIIHCKLTICIVKKSIKKILLLINLRTLSSLLTSLILMERKLFKFKILNKFKKAKTWVF